MRFLGRYLYQRRVTFFALAVVTAIFSASFLLYRLPLGAIAYPALLCGIMGLALLVCDFTRVKRAHTRLNDIRKMSSELLDSLPQADTILSSDYQEIIKSLQNEIRALENQSDLRYRETVDYYTVWVHQIKTPIAAMRLTLDNEDTPMSRRLLSELSRIERYVEMVLAYLRLDSASSDYVFKEHNLDNIIRQAVKKFASEFIDRKVRLDYEPTGERVVTDEKWLSFVIEQLLSNALKYTREGGSVRIYMCDKILCIEDTGIGIAPEDLPRIFEKGFTGINGRLDKKASGLGLYLCKSITKNLGIGISAASEPDRGTKIMLDMEQYDFKKE